MIIRKHTAQIALILCIGCATANRPDTELDMPKGPELEGPFVATLLAPEDLQQFQSTALTKFDDLIELSKIVADTTFAPTFRKAAFESFMSYFRRRGDDQGALEDLTYRLVLLRAQEYQLSNFTKHGSSYRAAITAGDGLQLEILLLQVQKSFGQEIHLIWDVKFVPPE